MRYIPLTTEDKKEMLQSIGADSIEELFSAIPQNLRLEGQLNLPAPMGERELLLHMNELAKANRPAGSSPSFLGAGAYNHFTPSAVDSIISRSEFYSSYTPYQPEVSQGTLQAIYEFQSFTAILLGMELANGSMYDGASALAEAALMACRVSKKDEIIISSLVHPRWRQVVKSYTSKRGIKIIEVDCTSKGATDVPDMARHITDKTSAVVVQSPNFFGHLEPLAEIGALCAKKKALFITGVAEPVSLGILKPPGDFGADIVVGEGQPLGLPLSFGGPYLGLFATRQKFLRQLPGRLCGKTVDSDGKTGYVLTLVAREQHIRREKATSNICSNQALCALMATVHMTLLGKTGLREIAKQNFNSASALKEQLMKSGMGRAVYDLPFFNEFVVELKEPASTANKRLARMGVIGGLDLSRFYPDMENKMLLTATELTTPGDVDKLLEGLKA